MRMEDLRYFVRVAETGSISQVAEECYITQQGLSRIISNLEKELGVRLFFRSNNRIHLTNLGEAAAARAKELDGLYQRMLADISSGIGGEERLADLHIYTTQLISATVLPKILSALTLRHPGVNLNIIELTPPEIADEAEFSDNSIGIVSITTFHQAESLRLGSGELVFETYYEDVLMLGVSENSPLASRRFITTRELAATPLALCNTEVRMAGELLEHQAAPTVALHTSSYDLCRDMISRNQSAGLTSRLRERYSKTGPVAMVPLEKKITVSYGCIYNPAMPMPPLMETVRALVKLELEKCL